MAVDSNAITLAEWAQTSNEPLIAYIVMSLHQLGSVLQDIPFVTKPTLKINGARYTAAGLSSPSFRALNSEPVVARNEVTRYSEAAFILSNNIDVDRVLLIDQNMIEDPRITQLRAWLETMVYDTNDKFINNNTISGNVNAPIGIRARLDNPSVYGLESGMKIDAAGVDITAGGITATNANNFIAAVQSLLDEMGAPDGDNIVLYMSELCKRRFEAGVRILGSGGGFSMVRDAFDRPIQYYKGAKIRAIGRKIDNSTSIITNTETNTGADGSSNFTSIYGVKYGDGYSKGWQMEPLRARDIGVLDNGVIYRLNVEYVYGIDYAHTRGVGRLYDIKVT